jgi:hypothetical protein
MAIQATSASAAAHRSTRLPGIPDTTSHTRLPGPAAAVKHEHKFRPADDAHAGITAELCEANRALLEQAKRLYPGKQEPVRAEVVPESQQGVNKEQLY